MAKKLAPTSTSSHSSLVISNMHASVDGKDILKGVTLTVKPGEIHAIMGPNGSGKSTLAYTLAGHPSYEVAPGSSVKLNGKEMLELAPDERANAGLFLAFQYPMEIPGVKVQNFLRQAYQARFKDEPSKEFKTVLAFRQHVQALAAELEVNPALLTRGLNEGFSGGEKKRLEILQMAVLEPTFAVLDETDSGLDVDAIKAVAQGVKKVAAKYQTGMIVITHYQRILEYLKPTHVHVLVDGQIQRSGDWSLVEEIDQEGYKRG